MNYLFKSSATINRYPMLQLVGLIQLTQILQMFVKAIFDEPTERTNWPSSQRNLNVSNEDVSRTQVEQQLQDGTICAVCVSRCKFGLVSSIFPELQNYQCSTAVGHPLPGGWIHISVCPDLPELLFLSTRFDRKNFIN